MDKYALPDRALLPVGFDQLEVVTVFTALYASYVDTASLRNVGISFSNHVNAIIGSVSSLCSRGVGNPYLGTLTDEFGNKSEQQGYRELYAGTVGVFRNRYAHRLVDPTPEDGGAFIVFVNLMLKMLEELRRA